MNPKPDTTPTETVPFFARKVADAPLAVRTGLRAGLSEAAGKLREDNRK
ncbi:MAG: hypothetical protein JWM10_1801 [Myxococcaceae bacterium]|nr:hypothetical protein [Myxococcaceae bacterium]